LPHLVLNLLLFSVTLLAGFAAMRLPLAEEKSMRLLLAFSGSFLLGVTLLHLIPETVEELGHKAGVLILGGFFLQLLIQRFTHGVEHGHNHFHKHGHHEHAIPLGSILFGLAVHGIMEGVPLGFNYRTPGTDPSLFLGVAVHKLPEIIIIGSMLSSVQGKGGKAIALLVLFAAFTPLTSMASSFWGQRYLAISNLVSYVIPVVAGSFIHIATTIFYESGTQQHALTRLKLVAIMAGVALAATTLLFH
jgi:zinc transporter ZupT